MKTQNHSYAIFLIKEEIESLKRKYKKKYADPNELNLALNFSQDLLDLKNSLKLLINKKEKVCS